MANYEIPPPSHLYFFLSFFPAPFVFAVPRTVFALFLRCFPIHTWLASRDTLSAKCPYARNVHIFAFLDVTTLISSRESGGLTLLPTRLLYLLRRPISHQPIMRLKFLHRLMGVVYQCKARRLATTVLCAETEAGDLVFVGFVEFGELGAEFIFGDVGFAGVEDITMQSSD